MTNNSTASTAQPHKGEKLADPIRKLLALAGNNPSEAEAAAAIDVTPKTLTDYRKAGKRLTETFVKSLKPPVRGSRFTYDSELTGFAIKTYAPSKVHPTGARTFVLSCWINGTERRYRIGSWPDWSVMAARAEAKDIRRRIDRGEDPAGDRRELLDDNLERRIADKALAFLNQNLEPACYLYRHYSPGGDLLYVGISLNAVGRQRRHMKGAGWHNMICRILIEPFETREQALEAEQTAIKTEFPKFNTVHNGRDLFREIATLMRVPANLEDAPSGIRPE
jgi:hypothetical protein